jgi:hypothetical protein
MCAFSYLAHAVTNDAQHRDATGDDPFARLFFDHTTAAGIRLLAVAEPVHHSVHGYLTAAAALAAFEEALLVAVNCGVEPGLVRAYAAANEAVRAANQLTVVDQRAFAGITAVAIDGQSAVIGVVPPGQSRLIQDGRLYGVPDLKTWSPAFMPCGAGDGQDPLGLRASVRPLFRRTTVREGDRLLLGASAVGRVIGNRELMPLADSPDVAVVDQLEAALEASGVEQAYAAWIRFDADPSVAARRAERLNEIDRLWKGQAAHPPLPTPDADDSLDSPRLRRSQRWNALHTRLIEVSERILGGRSAEPLPFETIRRAELAASEGSLRKLRATRPNKSASSFHTWLPRGMRPPISRREIIGLLLVLAIVCSALYGRDVRFARAAKPDRYLTTARTELSLAAQATKPADQDLHLAAAQQALNNALNHGAKPEAIAPWQHQLAAAKDAADGTARLTGIVKLDALPAGSKDARPRLLLAGDTLYLIAGSVYQVDTASNALQPVLIPGHRADGVVVGAIVASTVDGGALLVSDGATLFRLNADGSWDAAPLPIAGDAWTGAAAGAFKGSFYLLRPEHAQIVKFAASGLDSEPNDWLKEPDSALANAVDMEIDGSIHVLLANGTIETYFKGMPKSSVALAAQGDPGSFLGIAPGSDGHNLYAVEFEKGEATLFQLDLASGATRRIGALTSWHAGYDAAQTAAFGQTIDFAVDDAAGLLYFVTADGLWKATLPAA